MGGDACRVVLAGGKGSAGAFHALLAAMGRVRAALQKWSSMGVVVWRWQLCGGEWGVGAGVH